MRPLLNRTTGLLCGIGLLAVVGCTREALRPNGFVNVPGGRVAFRVMGERDGIPLLMIHGGPGSRSCTYPATMTGVAASRPVVMYDQLDSGNSDRMIDLQRDAILSPFVSEVAAIRAELGLREASAGTFVGRGRRARISSHSFPERRAVPYLRGSAFWDRSF